MWGHSGDSGEIVSHAGRAHLGHERETESDLLLRVRAGDMDAFTELVERNVGPALAVAKSIVDPATAEDVVADSQERLLRLLKRGEGPTYCVRPYFLKMVRNRAIDYQRRNPEIPTATPMLLPPVPPMPNEPDSDVVRTAFEALPERWQSALWLGDVEGRSNAEIGKELDVAESAASQLLFRAREGLRQSFLDAQVGRDDGCTQLSGLLGKYVRERASRRDELKIDRHLGECPSCRAAVAKTRDLNRRIGSTLAVGVLGGIALEVIRRPGNAMAAELVGGPARAAGSLRQASKAQHFVGAAAGVVITVGLVFGIPASGADTLADAIMSLPPLPTLSATPTPMPTPTPSPTPTPTPSPSSTPTSTTRPKSTPTPKPTPSLPPIQTQPPSTPSSPSPSPTLSPTPTPTPIPTCDVEFGCPTPEPAGVVRIPLA